MAMVRNLLVNGDFSEGNTGWKIEPYTDSNGNTNSAEIVPRTDSSKAYLKLSDTTGEKHYVVQQAVWVKPNTRYDLIARTFYLKGEGKIWRKHEKPGSSQSFLSTTTEAGFRNQEEVDELEIDGNWRVHFFTEENNQVVISFAGVSNSASQEFIAGIGQVFLYEHNLVKNGDFPTTSLEYWKTSGSVTGSPKVVQEGGNNVLELPTGSSRASQTIADIRPNTEYRLSFRVTGLYSGSGTVKVQPNGIPKTYNNQNWVSDTVDFTTGNDTNSIEIILETGHVARFDDISLAPIKRAAQL